MLRYLPAAKDGTTYYINNIDKIQLLVLLATFFGAAVIVVAAYAVFCLVASILEGEPFLVLPGRE